ncbi:EGF-like domain protein [Ancylostoma caninum]|uniref:EGF-like domain protein n=1 Tax=Ancylostoma caninum TaxID=29170 RepID=A0A368GB19_ANCCA|nr:EGF-like domain protein [Ancylostoma caninum]
MPSLPPSAELPSHIWSGSLQFGSADSPSFEGCLKDVMVGDLPPLSFYKVPKAGQGSNITYWANEERQKVTTTCLSSPQCGRASPCVRGECRDLWNTFTCICPLGFGGKLCEINLDDCSRISCGKGYCVDGIGEARCYCDPGFSGETCDSEMDMCVTMPCKNGALCTSSNGTFKCECRNGWVGRTCEIQNGSQCSEQICRNGGTCENTNGKGIVCLCRPGFSGPFCEERKDPCENRPCVHGYCKSNAAEFECECEEGYGGRTCSDVIDKCNETTCNGQGQCRPVWNATVCRCDKVGLLDDSSQATPIF